MPGPAHPPEPADSSWAARLWRSPLPWMAIVAIFFCAPLFFGLDRTDHDNDEAIYTFAVEVMLQDGDWLTPKSIPSETSAFLEKPPLKFWLNTLPIWLGWVPNDAFGTRVTDAALASVALLYIFLIGRRLRGPLCGLAAVFVMFLDQRLIFEHGLRGNNMESTVLLSYAGGIYHFLAWRSVNPDVKRHVFAMALYFVLGFMTKFVAALFLPAILVATILIRHEDRARAYRDWRTFAAAAGVGLALILPWFIYQYVERGPRLLEIMFTGHVVRRFTVFLDPEHLQPWHFYLTDLWRSLTPMSLRWIVVLGTAAVAWRTWRRRWVEGALILLWFALPVTAISFGTSKVYHYLYPFLPALYICGGYLVAYVAELAYRALERASIRFDDARRRALPDVLRSTVAEHIAIAVGMAGLLVAAVTAAFERIRVDMGPLSLRNSSVLRPALGGALVLLAAAPAAVVRAGVVAGVLWFTMPLDGYDRIIERTGEVRRPLTMLRDCAKPINDRLVANGRGGAAVWSDARLSYIPIYYLRSLGLWQRATESSSAAILEWLLYRPARIIVLGDAQWEGVQQDLSTNRAEVIARLAALTGPDPAIDTRLRGTVLGAVRDAGNIFLLPGELSACGTELVPLVSR